MIYGFSAPGDPRQILAVRAMPLAGVGAVVADGFRPPDAGARASWSIGSEQGLGVALRATQDGPVLIADDMASGLALSLIYSEAEAGTVFATAGTEGLAALAAAFRPGRPVFVFPDQPSPILFEVIRHTFRQARRRLPVIRMMPGGANPAAALSQAIHRQLDGDTATRTRLAAAFPPILLRRGPSLE